MFVASRQSPSSKQPTSGTQSGKHVSTDADIVHKPLRHPELTQPDAASIPTSDRSLIMQFETSKRDRPNRTDLRWNAEELCPHTMHTSASQASRPPDPFPCSVPSEVSPMPHDPIGNGRYCIESEFHSLQEFLQLCEGVWDLEHRRRSDASVCRTWESGFRCSVFRLMKRPPTKVKRRKRRTT